MTSRTVGEIAPDLRRRLVDMATGEFVSVGYERASLNKILHACGMSKSSFYHFVGSKEELFDMAVRDGSARLLEVLHLPTSEELGEDFWDAVARLLDAVLSAPPGSVELGRLFYLDDAPREDGSALTEAGAAIDAWLTQALAVGREVGAVRDDLPASLQSALTLAALRAMDDWSVRHLESLTPAETEALAGAQLGTVRRLLAR